MSSFRLLLQAIDKEAAKPLYVQLKESLLEAIENGDLTPHHRIPSERELSELTGLSRMTVRQAVRSLILEGRLYTVPGKGTFVADPKIEQRLRNLTGFTEEMRNQGLAPTSRVLSQKRIPAPANCARMLRIAPGAEVMCLHRLRLADGQPVAIEKAWLSLEMFPNLLEFDFAANSLYDVLRRSYRVILQRAEQVVEATLADEATAELLGVSVGAPLLAFERITYDSNGTPIEFVQSVYRSDRFRLRVALDVGAEAESAVQQLVLPTQT
ncbi:MAG: GntR family transcriptional regulator [Chloroflexi bacterium]|nr:GntR family transcriptional regulator [Chloroflexota bacterium]